MLILNILQVSYSTTGHFVNENALNAMTMKTVVIEHLNIFSLLTPMKTLLFKGLNSH